jgi:hypothetical protein
VECVERNREVDFINGVPNTGFESSGAGFRFLIKQRERHFLSQTQTNICFQRIHYKIHTASTESTDNGALRVLGGAGIGKNLNVGGDLSIQNELYILKQQLEQANY